VEPRFYRVGDLRVDLVARTVERGGDALPVKGLSFELLACLVRRHPELASNREINRAVWGDTFVGASTVTQRVKLLRDALAGAGRYADYIETVKGRGYRLVVPVEPIETPEPAKGRSGVLAAAVLGAIVLATGLWLAWPVVWPGTGGAGARQPGSVDSRHPDTLFVLPIRNAEGDAEWAGGLRQEILDRLDAIDTLSVTPIRELPPTAGADAYALESELVATAEGLELHGTLRDLRSGDVLFRQRIPGAGPGQDVRRATHSLAAGVADVVPGPPPVPGRMLNSESLPAIDAQAYELYLRARYHGSQYARSDLQRGIQLLDRALEIEPAFARGFELRSIIYSLAGTPSYGWMTPGEAFDLSRRDALNALALDPQLPLANVTLGNILLWHEWNPPAAAMAYQRAIDIAPDSLSAWFSIALLHTVSAQYEESLAAVDRAIALAPLQPGAHSNAGWRLLGARRFEAALAAAREAASLDPTHRDAFNIQAWAQIFLGRIDSALQVPDEYLSDAARGYLLAAAGRQGEARRHLAAMLEARSDTYVPPAAIAAVLIGLEEYEQALDWLQMAVDQRSREALFFRSSAIYDPLRRHPRFVELMTRVGIWDDFTPPPAH
jgi:DNA-binding winged helix-turn-helix (wHTH) protein/tetratricopeptide (TPR) repeat protein